MGKRIVVLSETGIADNCEWANSATEAIELVRHLMKLRRPAVRIEVERGNPVSFFHLKDEPEQDAKAATR